MCTVDELKLVSPISNSCILLFCTESLFVFPCQWNYRPDHCIYGSNCQQAEKEGIFILHGNRGVYHDDKQPAFRAVYEAIKTVSIYSYNLTYMSTRASLLILISSMQNIIFKSNTILSI